MSSIFYIYKIRYPTKKDRVWRSRYSSDHKKSDSSKHHNRSSNRNRDNNGNIHDKNSDIRTVMIVYNSGNRDNL